MLNQMRQWQNAFTLTLILICVGIGLSHNIEAALNVDHGEHCSICVSGNYPPVISGDETLFTAHKVSSAFVIALPPPAHSKTTWPDYTSRAPPLLV